MKALVVAVPAMALALALTVSVAFSEESVTIPEWIKNTAGWWSEGSISDVEFVNALQHLADEGVLRLGGDRYIERESAYKIAHPPDWERQIPWNDVFGGDIHDVMAHVDTMEQDVPATISISILPMMGETMEEHREWGLNTVTEYLGDALVITGTSEVTIDGHPGYVDEYSVDILTITIQGTSYSFERDGMVYEIKYESDAKTYEEHLKEAIAVIDTFQVV